MGGCVSSLAVEDTPTPPAFSGKWKGRWRRKDNRWKGRCGGGGGGLLDRRLAACSGGGGAAELGDGDPKGVPGRMFSNGASEVACLFTQRGRKGTNQDAMIVWENFTSRSDTIFCGVFDGHGPFGHVVAKKVRDSLPSRICKQWETSLSNHGSPLHSSNPGSMNSEETASICVDDEWSESVDMDENGKIPDKLVTLKQSFLKSFKLMDKELKLHPEIDCFCSGTTAVTLVKQGHDLLIGNVGDSRAVLGMRDRDNNLVAVQLTIDLKPNLPREAARIQQCRGRVFALQDEPEIARVWLPNNDSPGLAMARAFGDFCLKDYGLISVPDFSYRLLTERDEFVVLATDGVWDVLSNKEAVDIVAAAPTRATAARALVDCAVRAWRLKFPASKSDDCAAVCLFFDLPSSSNLPTGSRSEDSLVGEQVAIDNGTVLGSSSGASPPPSLDHSHTLHDVSEIVSSSEGPDIAGVVDRSQSTRSIADCISRAETEWSALEGVTRVNSLVNLPRSLPGEKKPTRWKKWL